MKAKHHITDDNVFKTIVTVSPEDILAAGGATAFGIKTGKNSEGLKKVLKNSPKPEPFTKEEWNNLVTQLENDK
jgi:hypothetical protein